MTRYPSTMCWEAPDSGECGGPAFAPLIGLRDEDAEPRGTVPQQLWLGDFAPTGIIFSGTARARGASRWPKVAWLGAE